MMTGPLSAAFLALLVSWLNCRLESVETFMTVLRKLNCRNVTTKQKGPGAQPTETVKSLIKHNPEAVETV